MLKGFGGLKGAKLHLEMAKRELGASDAIKRLEEVVKCDECFCWLDKKDAQEVNVSWVDMNHCWSRYYCGAHKKPYTELCQSFGERTYYGEIQMNEDGTPVGYVKANEKK